MLPKTVSVSKVRIALQRFFFSFHLPLPLLVIRYRFYHLKSSIITEQCCWRVKQAEEKACPDVIVYRDAAAYIGNTEILSTLKS